MIARLRGTVAARSPAGLLIDVGGVGYLVAATPRVTARVGEEATIQIHTHVREDALQLYGFADAGERWIPTGRRLDLSSFYLFLPGW